jgi:LacI family repressor for deo operon, udp, cdd, tsx, nupC, and nupG
LRSWYFSEIASGASEVLSTAGFRVELINLDIDSDFLEVGSEQFQRLFRQLGAGRSRDALLFAGITGGADRDGGRTLVPMAAQGGPLLRVPGVHVDHRTGGRLVAEHLLSLGHGSFVVVDGRMPGKPQASVWEHRSAGFLEVIGAASLDPSGVRVLTPGDCHTRDGERVGAELLSSPAPLPGAVFCHTDELAFGLIASLRRAGVHCPRDISIAGFDDHPMSRLWDLTTVSQHTYEQGVRAARALLGVLGVVIDGGVTGSANSAPRPLHVELIVRASTVDHRNRS